VGVIPVVIGIGIFVWAGRETSHRSLEELSRPAFAEAGLLPAGD
jgi:hypothetical protein